MIYLPLLLSFDGLRWAPQARSSVVRPAGNTVLSLFIKQNRATAGPRLDMAQVGAVVTRAGMALQVQPPQPERIGDHADGAQRHGRSRDDR